MPDQFFSPSLPIKMVHIQKRVRPEKNLVIASNSADFASNQPEKIPILVQEPIRCSEPARMGYCFYSFLSKLVHYHFSG
jgi:hypothetical protein